MQAGDELLAGPQLLQGGPLPDTADGLDRFFPAQPDGPGVPMEILMNNPGEKYLPIAPAFQAAIDGATRRLYVINPYLAERAILQGIVDAGRRGVDVRVIVPADPKSFPAKAAVRALATARCPSLSKGLLTLSPGESRSTTKQEMPRCPAPGLVTANTV